MANRAFPVPHPHGPPQVFASREEFLRAAVAHANNRLLHSCETIAIIGALAAQQKERSMPNFSVTGACIQDGTGSGSFVAAHVLPGQILINNKKPWEIAKSTDAQEALSARFAVTSLVPTSFNNADAQAEWVGLKHAFQYNARVAWRRVLLGERRDLTDVFASFLRQANQSFEVARLLKDIRSIDAVKRGDERAGAERKNESEILRRYQSHGVTPEGASRIFPLENYFF